MNDHTQQILDHIQTEYVLDDRALSVDMPLIENGIIDSMGLFRLIAFLEEHFGIKVAPNEVTLNHFRTVNDIAELVNAKQKQPE